MGIAGAAAEQSDAYDSGNLLCQPRVLATLLDACLKEEKTQVLTEIILQDGPLAARLLMTAAKNGVTLDGDEPISSAVQTLGIPALSNLALLAAQQLCRKSFSEVELQFQYRLWSMSQIGGIFARCLAPSVNFSRIEEAQLCGVLLNLGIHLLFHQHAHDYLDMPDNTSGSPAQVDLERQRFGIDHLQVADQVISSWRLDSFLADAIRFLHADVTHIAQSNLLLKVARQTQEFCRHPDELTAESQQLAEQLFGLKPHESHYLFHWGKDLFPPLSLKLDQVSVVRHEFHTALVRLHELSFLLAGREAARARLSQAVGRDELLRLCRQLLLEQSPAHEAFFFLLDSKRNLLTGMLVGPQQRLIRDLEIPLQRGFSLVADAYLENRSFSSSSLQENRTVTDNLLQRLCGGHGFLCCPLQSDNQRPGVVVLKLGGQRQAALCRSDHVNSLLQVISSALIAEPEMPLAFNQDGGGLLYQVSQEVKDPLTIINNYVEVLSRNEQSPEQVSLAAAVKREVRRIDTIFNDSLNRQEEGELFEQGVDLNQLIKEIVDPMTATYGNRESVSFELCLQEPLGRFQGSSALIRQILNHLVRNAVESFSDHGVVNISTRLIYVASRQWQVEVMVQDNGPGLPEQVQKNLFKPVFSTKGSGHAGVGLSLVKGMVAELNGQIGCYSHAATGTCFTIQIPYRDFEFDG